MTDAWLGFFSFLCPGLSSLRSDRGNIHGCCSFMGIDGWDGMHFSLVNFLTSYLDSLTAGCTTTSRMRLGLVHFTFTTFFMTTIPFSCNSYPIFSFCSLHRARWGLAGRREAH